MGLTLIKLPLALTLLLWTILTGLLPLKLPLSTRPTWLSLCSCFSGGVLLAIGILDMLVDVIDDTDEVMAALKKQYNVDIEYPMAQFGVALGLLAVLCLEQVALGLKERSEQQTPLIDDAQRGGQTADESQDGLMHQHSVLRSMLLLIALTFHSVFGGLAIGLQNNETQVGLLASSILITLDTLWAIFGGIFLHKSLLAFSLGVTLATSPLSLWSVLVSVITFASSTPLGIVLGVIISDAKESVVRDVVSSGLQAMACGTFLFITFFEILPHELKAPNRFSKILAIIAGFSLIAIIIAVSP